VIHPRLAPDDIEAVRKEMTDLQTRAAVSPRSASRQLLAETLAPGHPASGSVLGTAPSVGSITVDDLRAFHAAYVTGRRMILTASGPVDPGAAVRAVTDVFGSLPAGDEPPKPDPAPLTPPGKSVWMSLGKQQFYIAFGYLFDAEPDDRAALAVAGAILSDRLSFELREERGLAYSMGASIGPWAGRTRLSVAMGTRPENLDPAIEGVREGIAAFRESEIDEATVRRAANAMRGRMLMRRVTRVNRAYFTGVERLEGRPLGDDQARLDALLEVGASDVERVIRKYVSPDRCAVVTVR
jgi:zinc protease